MLRKLSFSLLALTLLNFYAVAEDLQYSPDVEEVPPKVSAAYVSLLEPLFSLVGAGIYQQIRPNVRMGISFGTNSLGYTTSIAYGLGLHYSVSPGRPASPIIGLSVASGEPTAGDRQTISYLSTGVDLAQSGDLLIGFGINWSLTTHNGKNLVMPYLRIGSHY